MNETRRPSPALLLCLLAFIGAAAPVQAAAPANKTPALRSEAALVLDRATGSVIYERHAGDAAPIASITK